MPGLLIKNITQKGVNFFIMCYNLIGLCAVKFFM